MSKDLTREQVEALLRNASSEEIWRPIRDYELESRLSPYEPYPERYIGIQMGRAGGFTIHKDANPDGNSRLLVAAPTLARQLLTTMDEVERYRQALAWYADEENHKVDGQYTEAYEFDWGMRAREALAGQEAEGREEP